MIVLCLPKETPVFDVYLLLHIGQTVHSSSSSSSALVNACRIPIPNRGYVDTLSYSHPSLVKNRGHPLSHIERETPVKAQRQTSPALLKRPTVADQYANTSTPPFKSPSAGG